MADKLDDAEFWLPSEFLIDDDIIMDKENFNKNRFPGNLCFPNEVSSYLGSFGSFGSSSVLSSPVESVVGSTEAESDEEDMLTGLNRQQACSALHETQKHRQQACSALHETQKLASASHNNELTPSAVGSWSGRSTVSSSGIPNGPSQVPSSPTSPLGRNDAWDLIFAVAGQVARLKMNGEGPPRSRGLLGLPRCLTPVHPSPPAKNPESGFYANQCLANPVSQQTSHFQHMRQDQVLKQQSCPIWERQVKEGWISQNQVPQNRGSRAGFCVGGGVYGESGRCARPPGSPHSAWPPLPVQHEHHQSQHQQQCGSGMRAVFSCGSAGGVKRQCAGTGVFLPRRYRSPSESRMKPGCSTALIPARVVQALNKNFDVTARGQPQAQPLFNGAFIPDYDLLLARRDVLLSQQRGSMCPEGAVNREIRLPQEWTY